MNLKYLLSVIAVLALPYSVNAQSTTSSYISTYGLIDIVGIMVVILLVVFAYALQKRRSLLLKIKNATLKQEIAMLKIENTVMAKEGARLQQEGGMLKKEYLIMMKEGARLQQEGGMLNKKLNMLKKKKMKARGR
jgi:hypothetical protein